MLVGIDFDNTIVCYDQLFHSVAVQQGLIPEDVPVTKGKVRDYLRQCGREDAWTELQGWVYGPGMRDAVPFSGVLEFFERCRLRDVDICIISHRTLYPFRGPAYDLHQSAQAWLEHYGFYDPSGIGLAPCQVRFELTRQAKLAHIAQVGCSHFIDDLPEFLMEPGFPAGVERILFDPTEIYTTSQSFTRATSWKGIEKIFMGDGSTLP